MYHNKLICLIIFQNLPLLVLTIYGGEYVTNPYEYPWMVKLNMDNCRYNMCGGSIISKKLILTAAHCVKGYGNFSSRVLKFCKFLVGNPFIWHLESLHLVHIDPINRKTIF